MFKLKPLSRTGIEAALKKAQHYRLLNEPWEAESICRDVLSLQPDHQEALVLLVLAISDQLSDEAGGDPEEAQQIAAQLSDDYQRAYYSGIIYERRAKRLLIHGTLGSGPVAFGWLKKAMDLYESAESIRPPDNDDAILRWNTCARLIMRNDLKPPPKPPGIEV